jgi:hypothetical protein
MENKAREEIKIDCTYLEKQKEWWDAAFEEADKLRNKTL